MFFHNFKYNFLTIVRNRTEIFWMLIFPLILGTMFYAAFGNLFNTTELLSEISVAIVSDSSTQAETFCTFAKEISLNDDTKLFKTEITDKETALAKLKDGTVEGIIFADKDDITMSVKDENLNQSIIKSVLDTYRTNYEVISYTSQTNPQNIPTVVEQMSAEINFNKEITLSGGNMDFYVQYFYNLLAMICILSSSSGLQVAIRNQAHLSDIGARKRVSPSHSLTAVLADFSAVVTVSYIVMLVAFVYFTLILKIDFGTKIPQILASSFIATIAGTSMGFCIGAIGGMKETAKNALSTAFTLFCCCLSGLMADSLPRIINQKCPIVNKINPVAIVTDCFYSLNIYDTYDRLYVNLAKLLIISAAFIAIGFLLLKVTDYSKRKDN